MSASIKNNRVTVYFGKRKDKILIDELDGIEAGDVSWFIKELMKDGIKYRKGGYTSQIAPASSPVVSSTEGANFDSLMSMTASKKELSNEETEEMFDKL